MRSFFALIRKTWIVPCFLFGLLPQLAFAAISINSATLDGGTTVTVAPGATISVTLNVTTSGSGSADNWGSSAWRIATTAPGTTSCDTSPNANGDGTYNQTFNVTAPASAGTYNVYFIAYNGDNCDSGASATFSRANAVIVSPPSAPGVTTNAASGLTASGATLNGTISSNNASTTVTFDYGTSTSYGSSVTAAGSPLAANASNSAVSASVTGLICETTYHFRVKGVNSAGTSYGTDQTFTTSACPVPLVSSINRASTNPTVANTTVQWTVVFSESVTGVNTGDFSLFQGSGTTGAAITTVSGSGTTYTVSATTGTGAVGTLRLDLVDDDSIQSSPGNVKLGGTGAGNGNYIGQAYTLLPPSCTPGLLFCDDFERAVYSGGSNTSDAVGTAPGYGAWTLSWSSQSACAGTAGNRGCAGIDSDIPPFSTASNPRANTTRALYTRWTNVSVISPVINLSGRTGAQISFWLRRGSDCFSEWPSNNQTGCNGTLNPFTPTSGEEFQLQYKNSSGAWVVIAQYPMDDAPGEILTPVIDLPDDALHASFQFRFVQPGGSGECTGGFFSTCSGGAPNVRGFDYWHVDNVSIREIPAATYTGPFCDTFEGDLSRWSTSGTGGVRIGSTYYQNGQHGMDLRWNTVSATTRATDLSTNSGNNLITYWVRRGSGTATTPNPSNTDYPETGKDLRVQYLNSSSVWTTLATFTGGGTGGQVYSPSASPTTNSLTLPADAKWSGFKLRFSQSSGSGLFDQDYWHVDDVCVGGSIGSTDLALSMSASGSFTPGELVSYTFTVTNKGPITEPGPITIVDTLPTGLTFASSSAGWLCQQTAQVIRCTQQTSLAMNASTTLTITALVDANAPSSLTNTATASGQSIELVPADNTASRTDGFFVPSYVFTTGACTNGTTIGTGGCQLFTWSPQTAAKPSANVYLTAVNASNVATQLSAGSPTTVGLQFGLTCHNPAVNAGVQATFSAAGAALPLCEPSGASPSNWTANNNQTFAAGSPSVGPFNFAYADAGEIELYVRKTTATTQIGKSGAFVVKPAGLCAYSTDLSDCVPATPGDYATCPAARKAGEAFNLTVKAVAWQSDSDTDLCSGNATTPNYQQTGIALSSTLVGLVGGSNGTPGFSTIDITTNGWASVSQTISEVGVFTFTATPPGYLPRASNPAGDTLAAASTGRFGRFYPDHFETTVTGPMSCAGLVFTTACPLLGNYLVYAGQPLQALTVTAYAVGGTGSSGKTTNYTGAFARDVLLTPVAAQGGSVLGAGVGTIPAISAAVKLSTFIAGTATLPRLTADDADNIDTASPDTDDAAVRFDFASSPSAPANVYFRAIESSGTDAVSSLRAVASASIEGGVKVVSGRLQVSNAFGSERLPLQVPLTVQYYTEAGFWARNTADSSTQLLTTASGTSAAAYAPAAHAGNAAAAACYGICTSGAVANTSGDPTDYGGTLLVTDPDTSVGISATTSTPSYPAVGSGDSTTFGNGTLSVQMSAPNASGALRLVVVSPPWLQVGGVNPAATVGFGLYNQLGNSKKIIYRREVRSCCVDRAESQSR